MRKFFVYIFICIAQILFSQKIDSSNIECKYFTTFVKDSTDIYSKKEEIIVLRIGDTKSIFKSQKKMERDSISMLALNDAIKNPVNGVVTVNKSIIPRSYFNQEVLKDNNKVLIYDAIFRNTYAFESNNKLNWKLVNEEKTISNYKCKKAVTKYGKRTITAWYTEEIPLSEGPYTFKGLPGLVIEVYDDKNFYHFTLISLKKTKKPIEPSTSNAIFTDFAKFSKKRAEYKANPVGEIQSTMGRNFSKQSQEILINNQKRNNNFLD